MKCSSTSPSASASALWGRLGADGSRWEQWEAPFGARQPAKRLCPLRVWLLAACRLRVVVASGRWRRSPHSPPSPCLTLPREMQGTRPSFLAASGAGCWPLRRLAKRADTHNHLIPCPDFVSAAA